MSGEENSNGKNMLLVAAASAAISGGGTHLVTTSGNDLPVNTTSIEDCRAFSQHAREHERANCEIEKNRILLECK
jgi:type 1 fimbria pilin